MTVTVRQLVAGDKVNLGEDSAIFIVQAPHAKYPGLQLVVWRLLDRSGKPASYSFDALLPDQEIGELVPATEIERAFSYQRAITP